MNKNKAGGSDFRRALHFVWHGARAWTLASGVLILVQGLLPPLSLYLMKLLVDAVSSGLRTHHPAAVIGRIELLVGSMALVAVLTALCSALTNLVNSARSLTLMDHMFEVIHAKSIEVDL